MFSLRDLRFVVCSRDLDILRAQRIIGVFTHKSTRSENPIPRPPRLKNRKLTRREASDNRVKKKQSGRKDKQRNHFFFHVPTLLHAILTVCQYVCLSVSMSLSVCLPLCVSLICLSSSCQHFFFLASFSFISVESAATKNHKQEFVAIQMATNCQCHRAVSTQASFVCVFVVVADVVVVVVVVLYLLYFSFVVQFPSKRMQTN